MVFHAHGRLEVDRIPDDIIIPDLIFDTRYGRRSFSRSNESLLIDAPTGKPVDIHTIKERTDSLAKGLATELGIGVGWNGVVGVFASNNIDSPTVFWAIHKLGGAISPANPGYGPTELAYQLRDSGSIALVTSSVLLPTALKALEEVPAIATKRVFLIDGDSHSSQTTVEQLIREGRKVPGTLSPLKLASGEGKTRLAFISYSSGTTGLPKGVMISHYNVISNVMQTTLLEKEFDGNTRDMTMCLLPLYHIYGLVYVLHAELYRGNTCIVVPAFEFSSFLSYIQNFRITKLFLVPPIVVRLVKDPLTHKYDLSSLEQITCGAAPLGRDTMRSLRNKFKGITFKQAYGMTETSTVVTSQLPNDQVDGSSGVLVPSMKAKLIDPSTGKEITAYNTPGELWVSGPNVTLGYLKNKKATNETWSFDNEGLRWLHTGDEVEIRKSDKGQEHYWIVDRMKELIKVRGYQVPPAELEALLLNHEFVEDAAVIGIPDEYSGEIPKAFVVLKSGVKSTQKLAGQIAKWVEERKVKYKWIKGGVEFVDSIPKTPSGKILRKDLRAREKTKAKL